MSREIEQAVALLRAAARVIALTGAGVSTPSGIPDFRSESSGLWNYADPFDVASLWAFHDHPERFYLWLRPILKRVLAARPNAAHRALAEMEQAGRLQTVITQNIDSLHQNAGSRSVLELHGHTRSVTCLDCSSSFPSAQFLAQVLNGHEPARCPQCTGLLKPDVVLFGEPLPYATLNAAQEAALTCDLMLVVGTSLEVMPAADLPLLAKRRGARLILINLTPTALDAQMDVVVRADVARALETIWGQLKRAALSR